MIITLIFSGIGALLGARLRSKFQHYSQFRMANGMSGKDVAEAMLRHYGISDVQVISVAGQLTDHYNPGNKTVNLSEEVYGARTIAAAAVAAHECGHAVQHATAYSMMQMRSSIVPVVNIASSSLQYLMMFGVMFMRQAPIILLITIIAFAVTTLFSLITLPVEFDASRRALVWLEQSNVTQGEEQKGAKDALWWAAMTYVCAAMASLVSLVYLIMQYMGRRE
ncbi:MAG: hypothetical protein RLZZ292_528 [Bacteroidota bacterium]|jgi:Zn-dependent membrane protease YugP